MSRDALTLTGPMETCCHIQTLWPSAPLKAHSFIHLFPSPDPLSTCSLDLSVSPFLADLKAMPQLLFLQNVGCQEDGVHPCIGEPGSSNITATVKQPGQQLLTEKNPPAQDQQMVRQTQPSDTVANLIPHLPWGGRLLVLCGVTCNTPYLHPQLGCGWVTYREMQA